MKFTILSGLLVGTAMSAAVPNMDNLLNPLTADAFKKFHARGIDARQNKLAPQGVGALPATPPPFDPVAQRVSNTGANRFIAPGPNDARGPCPGLNAMANHAYIPRNGVASIEQFVSGTRTVFGMAPDLGGFLARYGAFVDGNGTHWSIGGTIRTGISGSHNNYETDSSPIRADLNQYGRNGELILSQFRNLYNRQSGPNANYNLEVLRDFRRDRYSESIQKNPFFAYLPFSGIEVSQAAFTFIYRFMSNKSSEYPSGVLNREVLKSFMSITGPDNALKWVPGNEKIPNNWYKRNPSDEYSVPYFESDILYFASTVPQILAVGCNKGRVNTFTPVDPAQLTNGAYTAQQVAQSPICFASEFTKAEIPLITGLKLDNPLVAPLVSALNTATTGMNCASIGSVNQSAVAFCPGFSFYGGPTGPVAPGAIQTR
ncbi:putative chloroperoxidase [Septoria linicola]|nr:putative chloroperoxidase [Septoria linicola]